MNQIGLITILLAAFVTVYLETYLNLFRWLIGIQVDGLPGLMVYAALSRGPGAIALLAVCGGLWFDSLSANPAGISILPLLAVGMVIYANRAVILRNERFAQFIFGLLASAAVPVLSVLLLLTLGESPLAGWGAFWQLSLMALGGGILTPLLFKGLDRLDRALNYPVTPSAGFRSDREIKRGRI